MSKGKWGIVIGIVNIFHVLFTILINDDFTGDYIIFIAIVQSLIGVIVSWKETDKKLRGWALGINVVPFAIVAIVFVLMMITVSQLY